MILVHINYISSCLSSKYGEHSSISLLAAPVVRIVRGWGLSILSRLRVFWTGSWSLCFDHILTPLNQIRPFWEQSQQRRVRNSALLWESPTSSFFWKLPFTCSTGVFHSLASCFLQIKRLLHPFYRFRIGHWCVVSRKFRPLSFLCHNAAIVYQFCLIFAIIALNLSRSCPIIF